MEEGEVEEGEAHFLQMVEVVGVEDETGVLGVACWHEQEEGEEGAPYSAVEEEALPCLVGTEEGVEVQMLEP